MGVSKRCLWRSGRKGQAKGKPELMEYTLASTVGRWSIWTRSGFCDQPIGCILELCRHDTNASPNESMCTKRVMTELPLIYIGVRILPRGLHITSLSHSHLMTTESQRPKRWDGALSSLNKAIAAVELAKADSRITQAKAAFGSVVTLLAIIGVGTPLVSINQPLANLVHRPQRSTKWTLSTLG